MSVIRVSSGRLIDLLSPETADIQMEDIAHALAQINRFTGHTITPWTVAEHCIAGSFEVDAALRVEWMLHDAGEAYLGDVSKPLKEIIRGRYEILEQCWDAEIAKRFGLRTDPEARAEIKRVDALMLHAEAVAFMPALADTPHDFGPGWKTAEVGWVAESLPSLTLRGDHGSVKEAFLARLNQVLWMRDCKGEGVRS